MNQSTVEPAYLIAPVPGVWGWSFNLCLFASGIFSDLLLIKVCLTLGFSFMLVHALTGLPSASDGIATDEPRILFLDMVAWASLNALLHGFGAYRLIRDERSVALRNEEEERVWRFFFRRAGMERLEFREVVRRGEFHTVAAGETICRSDQLFQRFCLLIDGVAEMTATYPIPSDSSAPAVQRHHLLRSGAFFDLALANVFGIRIGLFALSYEATAKTDCRLLIWSFEAMDEMASSCSPSVAAYWRNMLLHTVSAALNYVEDAGGYQSGISSSGEKEPDGWAEGRARSADFDRELDEHERPLPKARAAWELLKRSINPFPPPGIRHSGLGNSGVPARTRLMARQEASRRSSPQEGSRHGVSPSSSRQGSGEVEALKVEVELAR